MNLLPINIDDLINARGIETERREFKKTWDDYTRRSTVRTICAFANDLHNLNGGYVIIGVEEQEGHAVLPPVGLDDGLIDTIQKQIAGDCRAMLVPDYLPLISPERYREKSIIVVWAPAGETRPYQGPSRDRSKKGREYIVRIGSESADARGDVLRQLQEVAPRIPFDDRRRHDLKVSEISGTLVRKFLSDVKSDLAAHSHDRTTEELSRTMRITARINGTEVPRNVALLMFCDTPARHFPYSRIEIAHFGDDAGGDLIEEKTIAGPLEQQARTAIDYVSGIATTQIQKAPDHPEAERFVSYPYQAVEESIVNAVIHRGYDAPPEPTKIYFYPDRLEITSYPGPVRGFDARYLSPETHLPPPPSRNRRIGEFFKELRLAELRGTGLPKIRRDMKENGSPDPLFDFDEARTYFRVTLPAHPGYVVLHAIRQSAQLWHTGERERALKKLQDVQRVNAGSGFLAGQLIEYAAAMGDLALARRTLTALEQAPGATDRHIAFLSLARVLLDRDMNEDARVLLENVPIPSNAESAIELAILNKRSKKWNKSHQIFTEIAESIRNNPKALHEYAQTKMKLASKIRIRGSADRETRRRLNREAEELLRRVLSLAAEQPTRAAWAWFDLARVMARLKEPETEVRQACKRAIELEPGEERFREWLSNRAQSGSSAQK
jgi:ATP-dependent DNA helicase RecG